VRRAHHRRALLASARGKAPPGLLALVPESRTFVGHTAHVAHGGAHGPDPDPDVRQLRLSWTVGVGNEALFRSTVIEQNLGFQRRPAAMSASPLGGGGRSHHVHKLHAATGHGAGRHMPNTESGRFAVVVPQHSAQPLNHCPPEDLTFDSRPPALVIVEQDSLLSELLFEDSILGQEVLDSVLLPAIDPAGKDQKQQMPWLKLGLHVPPDAWSGSAASGIVGTLSSVAPGVPGRRGKIRHYSRLRLGRIF